MRDMVERLHQRKTMMATIKYRRDIASALAAAVVAIDAKIDPLERACAVSDIGSYSGAAYDDPAAIRSIAIGAKIAADEFEKRIERDFVGGSAFGAFVVEFRAWATKHNLSCKLGASEARPDNLTPFIKALLAINDSLPEHLCEDVAIGTFHRKVRTAIRIADKASRVERNAVEAKKERADRIAAENFRAA